MKNRALCGENYLFHEKDESIKSLEYFLKCTKDFPYNYFLSSNLIIRKKTFHSFMNDILINNSKLLYSICSFL